MGLFGRKSDDDEDAVIDLTAPAEDEEHEPRLVWGRPGRCPTCGGSGYLEHIDIVDRVMYQKCTVCGDRWETTEAEVRASG